jgi:hypothetical protein
VIRVRIDRSDKGTIEDAEVVARVPQPRGVAFTSEGDMWVASIHDKLHVYTNLGKSGSKHFVIEMTHPIDVKYDARTGKLVMLNLTIYICIHVSMYLCIYVSMYLCIYVSMYLCIYVSMYLCIYVSMYLCIYVSMYLCIYVSMYLCIYVSMYLCIYVSMYLCIYVSMYL